MKIVICGTVCLTPFEKGFKVANTIDFKVDNLEFFIFEGFKTDLGSIPKPFRNLFNRFGLETTGYLIHDFGYRRQPKKIARKYWDLVLLALLKKQGVSNFKAKIIYRSLRLFGSVAWKNNKKLLKMGKLEKF